MDPNATPACYPCPFCGQQPTVEPCLRHGFFVSCDNAACLVMPETRDFDTEQQAADAWNQRAPQEQLLQEEPAPAFSCPT